jgi:uncharacterized membrane protein YgdD (TMEM256/DUF423 family)
MDRAWIGIGALYGLLGVILAALAAHALPERLSAGDLILVHTAIEMQMWHALALIACGALLRGQGATGRLLPLAGLAFALGTPLFCSAVYALALAKLRLSAVAPTGGFLLMAGWLLLAVSALRKTAPSSRAPKASPAVI